MASPYDDYTFGLPSSQVPSFNLDLNIDLLIIVLLSFFAVLGGILIIRKIAHLIVRHTRYLEHTIYLIRLPKDKPGDEQKEQTVDLLHEEISKGETIFSSIGGLRAQRGFWAWLLGRNDHFSFEIVASKKKIAFYAVAPKNMSRYIEQQIQAHYPDAVMEEVEDYNIFSPQSQIMGGSLKTKRSFVFPIKSFQKQETDPMNSLINVMSKLEENEGLAIQYIVRSAKISWHKSASKVVRKAHELNSIEKAVQTGTISKVLSFFGNIAKSAKPPSQDAAPPTPERLTAMEDEILKGIEEKNTKAGLDTNIRIVASAPDKQKARMHLTNISNAFSQYNQYEYGNGFAQKLKQRYGSAIINDFIYRRFNERNKTIFNTEELASLFHLPLKDSETPNILWLTARHAPAPTNIPEEGILLGANVYRGITKDIQFKPADRMRHTYVVGKSGGGKSQFIANMAIQDILNGEGVCVIDPHGDLVEDVLQRVPPERAEDVVVFSPADVERPIGLNLLEFDPKYPEQKSFVNNEMIGIFDKLYDLKSTGGPMFELYMRNAMLLVMADPESGSTLMEIPKALADEKFRAMKLERCSDPTVVDFWKKEAEKAGGEAALANIVPYITSKLTQFISNDMMRPIIGQQKSAINFRDIMDNQKILLIDLPKGAVGEMNAFLLGMIVVGKILMAALSRTDMPHDQRKPFYLYIDEFQNFTTNSICAILSEARKYGLGLIVAHQYINQLVINNDTEIKDAVFGNVGTMIAFRIGAEDAEFLEKEFSPVFNQFDLLNIEMFTVYAKLLIDNSASRPFSMRCPWPIAGTQRVELAKKIRTLSRLKYGKHRDMIEAQIKQRAQTAEKPKPLSASPDKKQTSSLAPPPLTKRTIEPQAPKTPLPATPLTAKPSTKSSLEPVKPKTINEFDFDDDDDNLVDAKSIPKTSVPPI